MSKLLLQLKQAQALREQARGEAASSSAAAATSASPQGPAASAGAGSPRRFPFGPSLLAAVIFLGVVAAWRAAPWKAPAKIRIDPAALKIDHHLDITRLRQTTPQ